MSPDQKDQKIPVGPGSLVAVPTAAILAVITLLQALLAGEMTEGALASGVPALLVLLTWLWGRFAQAAAKLRDAPSPRQKADVLLDAGEDVVEAVREVLEALDSVDAGRTAEIENVPFEVPDPKHEVRDLHDMVRLDDGRDVPLEEAERIQRGEA